MRGVTGINVTPDCIVMTTIIPAIIPESFEDLRAHTARVKGAASRVQIDICDGRYTPRASWPYNRRDEDTWEKIVNGEEGLPLWEDISYEIDMMTEKPEEKMDDWIDAGADTLIIHLGSTEALSEIMARAAERETAVAFAIRPSMDEALIEPFISQIAFVQVMGNDTIGRQGMPLEKETVLAKIRAIRARFPKLPIGVDIGVNEKTLPHLCKAGAFRFVVGSAIFGALNPREALANLEKL